MCLGSHYSVLFSAEPETVETGHPDTAPTRFDLHYYDELAMQDEVILLSIDRDPAQPLSEVEKGTDRNRWV